MQRGTHRNCVRSDGDQHAAGVQPQRQRLQHGRSDARVRLRQGAREGPHPVALHHERRVRAVARLGGPGAPGWRRLPGVRRGQGADGGLAAARADRTLQPAPARLRGEAARLPPAPGAARRVGARDAAGRLAAAPPREPRVARGRAVHRVAAAHGPPTASRPARVAAIASPRTAPLKRRRAPAGLLPGALLAEAFDFFRPPSFCGLCPLVALSPLDVPKLGGPTVTLLQDYGVSFVSECVRHRDDSTSSKHPRVVGFEFAFLFGLSRLSVFRGDLCT